MAHEDSAHSTESLGEEKCLPEALLVRRSCALPSALQRARLGHACTLVARQLDGCAGAAGRGGLLCDASTRRNSLGLVAVTRGLVRTTPVRAPSCPASGSQKPQDAAGPCSSWPRGRCRESGEALSFLSLVWVSLYIVQFLFPLGAVSSREVRTEVQERLLSSFSDLSLRVCRQHTGRRCRGCLVQALPRGARAPAGRRALRTAPAV